MTTTTATTSTGSAATAVQSATKSLLTSLDTGSGVDTSSLVTSLVAAQFAAKTAALTARSEKLTAQISGIATIKSAVTGFATALDTLAKGGTLTTQPRVSNSGVLTATALPGAKLSALSSSITVNRLAAAQTVVSDAVANRTAPIGSGTFTLQLGTATTATTTDADGVATTRMTGFEDASGTDTSVSFDLNDASLDSIAAAINTQAAKLGITASVVTDGDGTAYLSLKGQTGAAKAFTLTTSGDAALGQFDVGPDATASTTTLVSTAQNAQLKVDGVRVERDSNSISDLVAGVKLDLTSATGTPVTLSATRPTAALTQAMDDVVETYNTVVALIQEQTNVTTGTLAADPAAQALLRSLRGMTLASLNPSGSSGAPRTLAELGVTTARDGTLSVDSTRLTKVLASNPDDVEAMFTASNASTSGLPALLKTLSAAATSATSGLGISTTRYTGQQTDIGDEQAKITTQSAALTTRLTSQFSGMNARVTAYKSVQSFLTNQIAAWNKSDS